jgi:hypothetical protein
LERRGRAALEIILEKPRLDLIVVDNLIPTPLACLMKGDTSDQRTMSNSNKKQGELSNGREKK